MNTTLSYFEQKSKESRECNCPNAELPEAIGPFWNHGPTRSIRKSTRAAKQIDSPFGPLTFITPQQEQRTTQRILYGHKKHQRMDKERQLANIDS